LDHWQENDKQESRLWPWILSAFVAIVLAAYVGFRLPSLYVATLYNVRIEDGAWRRGLFGTLTTPIWQSANFSYWAFAVVALMILAVLLGIAVLAVATARWDAQRVLVIAWLVSPLGAYLFHEVGYLDQFVYLIFFIALCLVHRTSTLVVAVLMAFSVLVHEVTLFTVLPLIAFILLERGASLRQVAWLGLPVAVGVLLLFAPRMSTSQARLLDDRLSEALAFEPRLDAIELFTRSLSQNWQLDLFSPWRGLLTVLPMMALALVACWMLLLNGTPEFRRGFGNRRTWLIRAVGLLATLSPFTLVFFGWDYYRWVFLGLTNFTIVAFVLAGHSRESPRPLVLAASLLPLAGLFYFPLQYFDGHVPRPLSVEVVVESFSADESGFLAPPTDKAGE